MYAGPHKAFAVAKSVHIAMEEYYSMYLETYWFSGNVES
jgi:hypothetical protein